MNINSSALAAKHCVRNIGSPVAVGVSNSVDARVVGFHVGRDLNLGASHVEVEILSNIGILRVGEVCDERAALDALPVGEVDSEQIKFTVFSGVVVVTAALEAVDRDNAFIVYSHIVSFQLSLPVGVLVRQSLSLLGSVGTVDKGDDVLVELPDLNHTADHVTQATQDTKGLVAVLVAVAPRTPVDTFAPAFFDAGGVGQDIFHSGTQDNPTCCVFQTLGVGGLVVRAVVDRLHGRHSGVLHRCGRVVSRDLLARKVSEHGRNSSCLSVNGRVAVKRRRDP